MPNLLFIGSTVADVVVRVPALPESGDDLPVMSQQVTLGGCAYNAFQAARLSGLASCALLSPVGTGVWGEFVRRELTARRVVSLAPEVDAPNGCCYCLVEPGGERTFLCEHGAEYRFRPEWFERVRLQAMDGVYLCGLEVEEETGDVLVDALAKAPPARLYFAPGPRLIHIPPARLAPLFTLAPTLHLNETEALQFTRADSAPEAAAIIRSVTRGDVVITLGERGCYVLDASGGATLPAVPADVVDLIGAGDAHIGAVMAAQAAGMTLTEAARIANRVCAAVVAHAGAALPEGVWPPLLQSIAHPTQKEESSHEP